MPSRRRPARHPTCRSLSLSRSRSLSQLKRGADVADVVAGLPAVGGEAGEGAANGAGGGKDLESAGSAETSAAKSLD